MPEFAREFPGSLVFLRHLARCVDPKYQMPGTDGHCSSCVQFHYGEDGIDVMSTGYLHKFGFLASNAARFAQQLDLQAATAASEPLGTAAAERRAHSSVKCAHPRKRLLLAPPNCSSQRLQPFETRRSVSFQLLW